MGCRFKKGDVVETPVGVGEIISEIEITGACDVRLNKPLPEEGTGEGQREIRANTFQMRHVKS